MKFISIKHTDFELTIQSDKFTAIWGKATKNVGEENLSSYYSWSDGVESVVLEAEDGSQLQLENSKTANAFFFDNADYPIWVEFNNNVDSAKFGSNLQSDADRFCFHKSRHILSGFINYGNDIGRSEIIIEYSIDKTIKKFTFGFEVLSTKLDYHEHWKQIVEDIESEYRMLSLDFLKRTFHGFSSDINGEHPEIVWWSIFAEHQKKFVEAVKSIIDRPRHRLQGISTYQRADRLKRIPLNIENELAEHRFEPAHLYHIEEQSLSNDTQENRFLKYALAEISNKYDIIKGHINSISGLSVEKRNEIDLVGKRLCVLKRHPFFRTVGKYKGLNQESLILQKASGYSQVYRIWNILRRAYSLNDGIYRLQTKDIATLYEIWCFIEVSHIVKQQLHLTDEDIENRSRVELNGIFTYELGKGEQSKILFKKDGIELAELVYNPKHNEIENDSISIKNIVVPTVPQKPDIVLQLTKDDVEKGMKMTYLFDAKYRIGGQDVNNVDTPPDDAINQMHRYRDAIYYKDYDSEALKKEVIGGYILFPGNGEKTDIEVAKFYKSIEQVNIGAFPLRPKDEHNRELLEHFIEELIEKPSSRIISNVIPQKGTIVDVPNRVLVGLIKSDKEVYMKSFEDGNATYYYTGSKFPTTISLSNLHYFVPYLKDKGIRDVYRITNISTYNKDKKDLFAESTTDIRLKFDLEFSHKLFDDFMLICKPNIGYTYLNTTFEEIEKERVKGQVPDPLDKDINQ